MNSPETEAMRDEPRLSVPGGSEQMRPECEGSAIRSSEHAWRRPKPARPDVIDIARTWAVVVVGGLIGILIVAIAYKLLQP